MENYKVNLQLVIVAEQKGLKGEPKGSSLDVDRNVNADMQKPYHMIQKLNLTV